MAIKTWQHMEAFAAGGLSTLCLSYAELDHANYDECAFSFAPESKLVS